MIDKNERKKERKGNKDERRGGREERGEVLGRGMKRKEG